MDVDDRDDADAERQESAEVVGADDEAELNPQIEARIEQLVMERYSGPFPHPEHLERFAKLYPKAPQIIFDNFDKQSEHRRRVETTYMQGSERRANRGQWLAYSLVVLAIGAGVVAIALGQGAAGATIVTAAFAGGVVLYIAGGGAKPQPAARTVSGNSRDQASAKSGSAIAQTPEN